MKRLSLLALTLLVLVAPGFAQYQYTSLDFPGAVFTTARGINNHGDIVGAYRVPFTPRHAMLIRKGEYIPIAPDSILGVFYSEATNINDRGDISGQMVDTDGFGHGFVVIDGVVTIFDVPGASETFALGINDSGVVAGYWDLLDADLNTLAIYGFTWKDGSFINTQINYPGAGGSGLFGINARGDLSGVWVPDPNGPVEHGFICPITGQCFSYDSPRPGTVLTQGNEINVYGQVVGVSVGADDVWHGFLLSGGTFTTIDVPGSTGTGPYGINSAGQIVGKYFDADGSTHGFLAQPEANQKPQ